MTRSRGSNSKWNAIFQKIERDSVSQGKIKSIEVGKVQMGDFRFIGTSANSNIMQHPERQTSLYLNFNFSATAFSIEKMLLSFMLFCPSLFVLVLFFVLFFVFSVNYPLLVLALVPNLPSSFKWINFIVVIYLFFTLVSYALGLVLTRFLTTASIRFQACVNKRRRLWAATKS